MTDLSHMTEHELRVRIMLVRRAINWLNSNDPYIMENDELGELLPKAKSIYEGQLAQLEEAYRVKVKPPDVVIGLNKASLKARKI